MRRSSDWIDCATSDSGIDGAIHTLTTSQPIGNSTLMLLALLGPIARIHSSDVRRVHEAHHARRLMAVTGKHASILSIAGIRITVELPDR